MGLPGGKQIHAIDSGELIDDTVTETDGKTSISSLLTSSCRENIPLIDEIHAFTAYLVGG